MTAITKEEIKKLAALARLQVTDEEVAGFSTDIEAILGYVGQLGELDVDSSPKERDTALVRNVVRADEDPYPHSIFSAQILKEAPQIEDKMVKVKNIL